MFRNDRVDLSATSQNEGEDLCIPDLPLLMAHLSYIFVDQPLKTVYSSQEARPALLSLSI